MAAQKKLSLYTANESAKFGDDALFPLESIQSLTSKKALQCQSMLGHGATYGIWETPESMIPHMRNHMRRINLRRRLELCLPESTVSTPQLEGLLDEGVLWLTRIALLMRVGPAGVGIRSRYQPLDASSITGLIYTCFPVLIARGITHRLEFPKKFGAGFACTFTEEDQKEWWVDNFHRANLKRLSQLHGMQLWSDAPPLFPFMGKTTPVKGDVKAPAPKRNKVPFLPIPDDYLAEMGPRVLWIIKDLGPNLIHLIDALSAQLKDGSTANHVIGRRIRRYFKNHTFCDRNGQVIDKPPFPLLHQIDSAKNLCKDPSLYDPCEWPPNNWSSVQTLCAILQGAHLWIALLVMVARIGEVATLGRNCVVFARDGQSYANGKTYKASSSLTGKDREWPIPDILVDVLAQQVKLIEACERLALTIKHPFLSHEVIEHGSHLWSSLSAGASTDATGKLLTFDLSLLTLAKRIGMTDKPGGRNLHPHRFRKTMARLGGLAIDGSQKVLMLLLGHEDVTTTLGYMQSDPAFAKELDDITRELRIMRGETLINDMRAALLAPQTILYGGHGGGGAAVLSASVNTYEENLHRSGEEWGINTARELSVLLTNNGESARLISAHVVCTKTSGEVGLCSKKKGSIVSGNCQSACSHRIEDKTGRRDTERVIPILVKHAQENIGNNDWLPLARDKKQLELELQRYDDIGERWRAKPEVQAILGFSI